MKNKKILSIHLMTFNHEHFIKKCLNSILNHECSYNYEIIITDDASTDKTASILNDYKKKHPDIIDLQLNKNNKGIITNYFETLNRCNGEYVFDISGDDFFNRGAINIICDKLIQYKNIDFIEFEYDEYFEKTNNTIKNANRHLRSYKKEKYLNDIFSLKILPYAWCIKTSLLKNLISLDELKNNNIYAEDYPIAIELIANNKNFIHDINSVMTYRKSECSYHSASNFRSFEKNISMILSVKNNFIYYAKKYNIDKAIVKSMEINIFYSNALYYSSLYNNKKSGKIYYLELKQKRYLTPFLYFKYLSTQYFLIKKIHMFLHYLTNQNSFIRRLQQRFKL